MRLIFTVQTGDTFLRGKKGLNLPFFFSFYFSLIFCPVDIYFARELTAGNSNNNLFRAKLWSL